MNHRTLLGKFWGRHRSNRSRATRRRSALTLFETLETRAVPTITAAFTAPGQLLVLGDSAPNVIVVSRNAAGTLLVNNGAVPISGGVATVANSIFVNVFGGDGDDTITLDEANGPLPRGYLFGGNGNDLITGGSSNDLIFGQAGDDVLRGGGGDDSLFAGAGQDRIVGGSGSDVAFGEEGDDRFVWNPGDDSDLNEGGVGTDTTELNGGNGSESFTITPNGSNVRIDRVAPAPFSIDVRGTERIVLNANGGDDTVTASNGLAALVQLTVDGGTGNDTITGGDGADLLIGGPGQDLVRGGRGNDTALLGDGDDTFVWNPGDGSDTVEGQGGSDSLLFNGANISEKIAISSNGSRVRFVRDVANVVMDLNGLESLTYNALGGADQVNVGDLSGTDAKNVVLNLAGTLGGSAGDGQVDRVVVNGTNGSDNISVTGSAGGVVVAGLPATVVLSTVESTDLLTVQANGGNDTLAADTLVTPVGLTLDGGTGDDSIRGSILADVLIGGDGQDSIVGGRGDDTAFLGAGDDVFTWNPGDGSDTVEGQAGTDALNFNGANVAENIDLSANGGRLRFFRDVANITMDTDEVETVTFRALGGADRVVVGDLTGTDVKTVNVDLSQQGGSSDGAADSVVVVGTVGDDSISVNTAGGVTEVAGLASKIRVTHGDPSLDNLEVNGLGGNDVINASGALANAFRLLLNGGEGADLIVGSAGNDSVNGGRGNDTLLLGAGDDTFVWNPGDGSDTVEGQQGFDSMIFNGANVSERVDISANGGRILFTRNVASILMDLNDVEKITFNALGGADRITLNDVSGTDLTDIRLNLGGTGNPAGDGSADLVAINGTNGDDVFVVSGSNGAAQILGLAAGVSIEGAEPGLDQLWISALNGDDVIQAAAVAANSIALVLDGGQGDDVLVGGDGDDTLIGGDGDDVLIGGNGLDVLDGGNGNNIVIQ